MLEPRCIHMPARPKRLCGFAEAGCPGSGEYGTIHWADGSEMFAADNESTVAAFLTAPVDSSGFGSVTAYSGVLPSSTVPNYGQSIHYDKATDYIYGDDGNVLDPSNGTIVGSLHTAGPMVPDGILNKAFFVLKSERTRTLTP